MANDQDEIFWSNAELTRKQWEQDNPTPVSDTQDFPTADSAEPVTAPIVLDAGVNPNG